MPNLLSSKSKTLLPYIAVTIVVFLFIVFFIVRTFYNLYRTESQIETTPRQIQDQKQTFSVKKVTIKERNSDCYLEILSNGTVQRFCGGKLQDKDLIANDQLLDFFSTLDEESFNRLLSSYFSDTLDLVIIIETNYGTKTITINSSGEGELPDVLQDIIDKGDEIGDQLDDPDTSPPPSVPPSSPPTIPPGSSPTPSPTPSPTGPTPTPHIYQPGELQNTFDCTRIPQTDVTISNTHCLQPNQGQSP